MDTVSEIFAVAADLYRVQTNNIAYALSVSRASNSALALGTNAVEAEMKRPSRHRRAKGTCDNIAPRARPVVACLPVISSGKGRYGRR